MAQRTKQAGLTMSTSLDGRLRDYCDKHHLGRTEALSKFLDNAEKNDVLIDCLTSVRDTMERNNKLLQILETKAEVVVPSEQSVSQTDKSEDESDNEDYESAKDSFETKSIMNAKEQLAYLNHGLCPKCGSSDLREDTSTFGKYLKCKHCGYTAGIDKDSGKPYINKANLNGIKPMTD